MHFASGQTSASLARSTAPAKGLAGPRAPFGECPKIGADTGCGALIDITRSGHQVVADHSQGPYDGSAATLVGVLNSSRDPVSELTVAANTGLFVFGGTGICSGLYRWRGARTCPFGPTGYEGPGTSFSGIGASGRSGTVTFSPPIAPGQHAYFALAQAPAATMVAGGSPWLGEQGGAPNPAERQNACSKLPVNCATGEFWETYTDFSVPGFGVPLELTRTYTSGLAMVRSPFGFGWSFSYGMRCEPGRGGNVTIHQANGANVTFTRTGAGPFAAPPRVMATLTGSALSGYTFTTLAEHTSFVFSPACQLTEELRPGRNPTRLAYTAGHLASVTDASGRRLTFTYHGSYIHSVTDPAGRTETFTYNAVGNLKMVRDPAGRLWQFSYYGGHLMRDMTKSWTQSPQRIATAVSYRPGGRVSALTTTDGGRTSWSYAGDPVSVPGGSTTVTSPGHDVTAYDYSGLQMLAVTRAVRSPVAATTGYTYGREGLAVSVTDPDLHVTRYAYDSSGDLTSVVNPRQATTRYTYRLGEVTSITEPGYRQPARYWYRDGSLVKSQDPVGQLTSYQLSPVHPAETLAVSAPSGRTSYTYDRWGDVRTMSVSPRQGITDITAYAYNADGQVTAKCHRPRGRPT